MDKMRLNLGSGKTLIPGYINIDILEYGQEIKRSLLHGIPFGDSSITEIYTCHFLEHLHAGPELMFVMHEVWRVLKTDGRLVARVPHMDSPGAFDRAHHSYWSWDFLQNVLSCGRKRESNYFFDLFPTSHKREKNDFLFILVPLKCKLYNVLKDTLYVNYVPVYSEG